MYVLETVDGTENIAYKHVPGWIALFSRFRYTIVNYSEQLSQANCMDENTQKIYDSLPQVSPYNIRIPKTPSFPIMASSAKREITQSGLKFPLPCARRNTTELNPPHRSSTSPCSTMRRG